MGSQTLELKWANHKANMTSELQELYLNDALLDVTIACGEFTLKAHKTVLSASSSFFRKLFINNPCKHPILIMTDVDFEDLKTIVEFMYQGEVHISRDKLTQFLKTADRLKVKGLTSIEDMNLNAPEHFEVDVDTQYSCGAWDDNNVRSQSQSTCQVEDNLSSRKKTESVQKDTNQEMLKSVQSDTNIKLEHDASQPANDDCMYWQSECFDQTSSSVLPDCSLPSTSSVSHQPSTSVSHQVPLPHQLSTSSVSHQLSPSSVSHQLSTSIPSEHSVPLNNEGFTFSESQTDSGIITQVQGESSGREIIPVSLYQSQDQSPIAIATSSKSFEATDSISSQPSQSGNSDREVLSGEWKSLNHEEIAIKSKERADESCAYYDCNNCQKTFPSEETLKSHIRQHDRLEEFVCTMCSFKSSEVYNFLIHKKTHTCEERFVCRECNKRFMLFSALKSHERMHTSRKSFHCNICSKQFSRLKALQSHENIHTGERPYLCKTCLKRFRQPNALQNHERTHTGEKPYLCAICHRRFTQLNALQIHQRTHTGEKPYACSHCHKRYADSSNLKRHERTHMLH